MDCIFCKIANKEMTSYTLYEDELIMVILDAYPNVDGHTLIIPKKHYETFKDIPEELLLHINKVAQEYTDVLMEKLNTNELTLVVNYGNAQKIKHYHLHLLPNFGLRPEKNVQDVFEVIKNG